LLALRWLRSLLKNAAEGKTHSLLDRIAQAAGLDENHYKPNFCKCSGEFCQYD
jgi:hypothetical protein